MPSRNWHIHVHEPGRRPAMPLVLYRTKWEANDELQRQAEEFRARGYEVRGKVMEADLCAWRPQAACPLATLIYVEACADESCWHEEA
jgi:hypothetical protein